MSSPSAVGNGRPRAELPCDMKLLSMSSSFVLKGTMNIHPKDRRIYFTAVIAEHTKADILPQTKPATYIKKGGVAKYGT